MKILLSKLVLSIASTFILIGCTTTGGQSLAGKKWYATCESGHFLWEAEERPSYKDANKDAEIHDKKKHDGKKTAVVLNRSESRIHYVNFQQEHSLASTWLHEEDIEVTGLRGFGEHCIERTVKSTDPVPNPKYRLEAETTVLQQDKDTHWIFTQISNHEIKWRICADNCLFSCDTIKLHIRWRVVPLK